MLPCSTSATRERGRLSLATVATFACDFSGHFAHGIAAQLAYVVCPLMSLTHRLAATLLSLSLTQCQSERPALAPEPPQDASALTTLGDARGVADASNDAAPATPSLIVELPAELALEPELPIECTRPRTAALPEVPTELRPAVERHRRTVRRAASCFESFFRTTVRTPNQCERWFRSLDAGGDAAMHAIGIELAAGTSDSQCQSRFISASVNRLARSLAKSPRPEAMLYLVRAVAMTVEHTQSHSQESSWQAYEGLLQIAGGEVQPIVPPLGSPYSGFYANWADTHELSFETWNAVLGHWMRWYFAHRSETPAQWQAANLPRTRAELRGASPYRALAAAIVLYERQPDREEVERFVSEQLTGHERDEEPPPLARPLDLFASQRALEGGGTSQAFRWLD
jgi:hypothetical protein